jgi:hypothetical protein
MRSVQSPDAPSSASSKKYSGVTSSTDVFVLRANSVPDATPVMPSSPSREALPLSSSSAPPLPALPPDARAPPVPLLPALPLPPLPELPPVALVLSGAPAAPASGAVSGVSSSPPLAPHAETKAAAVTADDINRTANLWEPDFILNTPERCV